MRKAIVILMASAFLWSTHASAEVIFRYNHKVMNQVSSDPGDPTGPTDPTDPGGEPPVDPDSPGLDCSVADPSSEFTCQVDDEKLSDDPNVEPLRLTQIPTPAGADTVNYKFRCLHASGGYGNYIYEIGGYMPPAVVSSLDFVTTSDPNGPARGTQSGFWWPGYEGDYDLITGETNVCLRLSVNSGVEFDMIVGRVWLGDYPDDVVEGSKVDYTENSYDAEYAVLLYISGDGSVPGGGDDGGGDCGEVCGPDPDEPVTEPVDCPAEVGSVPFTCLDAEVSEPEESPGETPRLVFEWLPTPADAAEDYHGYQCFRIAGGNGNYTIMAEGDLKPWVYAVSIVPYSTPNAAGNDYFYDNYPKPAFDENWNYIRSVTHQRDFCLRLTPDASYQGDRADSQVKVLVEDFTATAVFGGDKIDVNQRADSILKFNTSISGSIFTNTSPWKAVVFEKRQADSESKTYGVVEEHMFQSYGDMSDTRALSFFYKCFIYSGGPNSQWHYSIDDYFGNPDPAWVEWWDIRPLSQINVPYQWKDPQSPGSSHQYWPMGMSGDTRALTSENNICVRVKPKVGSTNKDALWFSFDKTHVLNDGLPGSLQVLRSYWLIRPL